MSTSLPHAPAMDLGDQHRPWFFNVRSRFERAASPLLMHEQFGPADAVVTTIIKANYTRDAVEIAIKFATYRDLRWIDCIVYAAMKPHGSGFDCSCKLQQNTKTTDRWECHFDAFALAVDTLVDRILDGCNTQRSLCSRQWKPPALWPTLLNPAASWSGFTAVTK